MKQSKKSGTKSESRTMYERTQKYEQVKKSRLRQIKKEMDHQELKEMKRKPAINPKSDRLAGRKALNGRGSYHGSDASLDIDNY